LIRRPGSCTRPVIYVARRENARAQGPYPAPADLLVTDPAFRSQTAATEKDPFSAIYETRVALRRRGRYLVLSVSRIRGQTIAATSTIRVTAADRDPIPDVGQRAPRVRTDTVSTAAGNIKSIDTRLPPDDMHDTSLRDVLARKPVALLFATPALCQSRVCGPVVDIAEQLKQTYGDRMTFIHQEVYVDNNATKGLRPPLLQFHLQTEPWLFVVNRAGVITARLEGSIGVREFENAVKTGL
jgi:hypothetical protein